MNTRDFSRSLRKVEETLRRLDLVEEVRQLVSMNPSVAFKRAAFDSSTPYCELYRTGLGNFDYNILLTDLSYFQFHCTQEGIREGLRYAFFPNPYHVIRFSEFCEQQQSDLEDGAYEHYLQHLSEMDEHVRVPLLRFDVATNDYTPLEHPAAHMHIGHHGDNRWPCARIVTPHAFVLWVLKLYYGEAWAKDRATSEAALIAEKNASVLLANHLFSAEEEKQFFFG